MKGLSLTGIIAAITGVSAVVWMVIGAPITAIIEVGFLAIGYRGAGFLSLAFSYLIVWLAISVLSFRLLKKS